MLKSEVNIELYKRLYISNTDIEQEFSKIVDNNFWELIDTDKGEVVDIEYMCPLCFRHSIKNGKCENCNNDIERIEPVGVSAAVVYKDGYIIKTYLTETPPVAHLNITIHEATTDKLLKIGYIHFININEIDPQRLEFMREGYIIDLLTRYKREKYVYAYDSKHVAFSRGCEYE